MTITNTDRWANMTKAELIERLALINQALERLGCEVLITADEAKALPKDNLIGMVAATADQLVIVTRKLQGSV